MLSFKNFLVIYFLLGYSSGEQQRPKTLMWGPIKNLKPEDLEPAGSIGNKEYIPVYLVRATVEKKGKMPGYISDLAGPATIMTGNGNSVEVDIHSVQTLNAPKASLSWVKIGGKNGLVDGEDPISLPRNVLVVGQLPNTEPVYMCRALIGTMVIPGFFAYSRQSCTVLENGAEAEKKKFEMLCLNEYGIHTISMKPK